MLSFNLCYHSKLLLPNKFSPKTKHKELVIQKMVTVNDINNIVLLNQDKPNLIQNFISHGSQPDVSEGPSSYSVLYCSPQLAVETHCSKWQVT